MKNLDSNLFGMDSQFPKPSVQWCIEKRNEELLPLHSLQLSLFSRFARTVQTIYWRIRRLLGIFCMLFVGFVLTCGFPVGKINASNTYFTVQIIIVSYLDCHPRLKRCYADKKGEKSFNCMCVYTTLLLFWMYILHACGVVWLCVRSQCPFYTECALVGSIKSGGKMIFHCRPVTE